ncbi:MAG: lectin [Syntrophales bacterium]
MKEAKHFLKVTTLVLYATFVSLTPAIVCAADRLNPGELLKAEDQITSANGQYRLIMQRDGNLVLYDDARRQLLWETNTQGQRVDRVIMQRDGNLVLYLHSGQPVWASNTAGKPGSFLLVQNDGNMVIYQPQGIWASNTAR